MDRFPRLATAAGAAVSILLLLHASPSAGGLDGKKLFADKTCVVCHSINGPSIGPGPELTQVTLHRDPAWLRAWLTDPQKIRKGTIMPKPAWKSPEEMEAVIQYLESVKRPVPAADSANGERLFADFNCGACHAIHGKGGKPQFPDLVNESKVHSPEFLDRWLQDPSAVRPGTFMAKFPLTSTQRKALVAYIVSLAKK